MFIHDFAHIPRPYSSIRRRVTNVNSRWIEGLATEAYGDGVELRIQVGPRPTSERLSKAVRVHFEAPYPRGDGVVLAMSWVPVVGQPMFPSLEADLEFGPVGDELTQVSLSGMYEPPLGKLGKAADALLLHRVAEATVRSFLARLAEALAAPDPPHATTTTTDPV